MSRVKESPIGERVLRKEDAPLIAGKGKFVANLEFPDTLHMSVCRSEVAYGKIKSIDTQVVESLPGVFAVWTHKNVAELPLINFRPTKYSGLKPYRQPILANTNVRYVGEPLAVVFAENAYIAEDGVNLLAVEIEELQPVVNVTDEPTQFSEGCTTEVVVIEKGYGAVEKAFKAACHIVELDLSIGRHSGVPLECRGCIAVVRSDNGVLELYGATKRAHPNRDLIAKTFGLDPQSVNLFEGNIGGGFGIRGELYPEDFLACAAALKFKQPIKWIEDRREHLLSANHSRQQRHQIRAAVDSDGLILAIEDRFWHDQGAYLRTHGVRVPDMTAGLLLGPYHIPAYRASGHVRLTNKTPAATYRAPGRFEGTFARERLMDAIANRVGIECVEVRVRNMIKPEAMPYSRDLDALEVDVVLESGDYPLLIAQALDTFKWIDLQEKLRNRRSSGELVGAGLAFFVEKSGLGPTEKAIVRLDAVGNVTVITGAANLGQGVATAMTQICASVLGLDYANINFISGRTDVINEGYGSHASRTTVMTGEAVRIASQKLKEKIIASAALLLQAGVEQIKISAGRVGLSSGDASVSFEEIIKSARVEELSAEGRFDSTHMNYPYGLHLAVVSVDPQTGISVVEKFFIAYDIGCAVNPMLIEGQLQGGFAQGVGGALLEEFLYDSNGQPLCSTFVDYIMPGSTEIPKAEILLTENAPSPLNPLGIKGAGEGGINAVGAAIASAIDNAIDVPGAVKQLPVTPKRMLTLLSEKYQKV